MVDERTQHVWRQRAADDDDVWLDIMRVDTLPSRKGQAEGFQETTYRLKWGDEAAPLDHPTRTVEMLDAANPEDDAQIVPVPVIKKYQSHNGDQKITHSFVNGDEVETRIYSVRRVYHRDTVAEPPLNGEDYEVLPDTIDETQYIDVALVEAVVTTSGQGETFQKATHHYNTEAIEQFSVPAPDGYDETKVVHLDPLQNIVNVQWGGTMFVAGITGSVLAIHHSNDGEVFALDTTTVSGNAIVYGNGKWFAFGQTANLYQSDDGINWIDLGSHPLGIFGYSACFGNDIFVLGGWGIMAWSDDDGATWNVHSIPGVSEDDNYIVSSLNFIKADPDNPATVDRYFAGLRPSNKSNTIPLLVMTSTDGVSWSSPQTVFQDGDFVRHHGVNGVAYGNEKYVVAGGVGYRPDLDETSRTYVAVSTNGTSWGEPIYTGVAHPGGDALGTANSYGSHIAFGNGRFVVVGNGYETPLASSPTKGTIAASSDGASWAVAFEGATHHTMGCVEFGGGNFLAGGLRGGDILNLDEARPAILQSEDGLTWTYSDIQPNPGQTNYSGVFCIRKGSR